MTDESPATASFPAHVELLRRFLSHRTEIVDNIQDVLNAQRKPASYLQDRRLLSRHFEDCLFVPAVVTQEQSHLRGQLEQAHWASGFSPREATGLHNDLIHPAEMMIRGFHFWRQTRWPGRNGRVRYAQTLFNVYLVRCLELLSMRTLDAGPDEAGERLARVQSILDEVWKNSPSDQPVLVRDARWLIPLAQSPTTDELRAYFEVAEKVAQRLPEPDRLEVQKAHTRILGGHLTSQIRHYCIQDGLAIDDDSIVRRTRTSNALDFALLVQALVPLLEAYENAIRDGETGKRLDLAGAVCQGISPDPEVFLNRIDLLGPYSMIEHLFVTANGDGRVVYSRLGERHIALLENYETLITRLADPLREDCPQFRPRDGAYSPYGAIYGTPSHLTEHMALKALQRDGTTRFSVEDVFADGGADKLEWVDGWRQLPHIPAEVQKLHAYPHEFASNIYDRIEQALRRRSDNAEPAETAGTGRIVVLCGNASPADPETALIDDHPIAHIGSSDTQLVAAQKAERYDQTQLLHHRQEGHFLVSFATPGGWVAIKKDMLTEVLGAGRDAKIAGLPPAAAETLRLMCPGMVVEIDHCNAAQTAC